MNHVGPLPTGALAWLRTILIVMVGWVFFRANDMGQALHFLSAMAGFSSATVVYYDLATFLIPRNVFFAAIAIFFALYPFERFSMGLGATSGSIFVRAMAALAIFVYAAALLQVNSFNPFIYFRF